MRPLEFLEHDFRHSRLISRVDNAFCAKAGLAILQKLECLQELHRNGLHFVSLIQAEADEELLLKHFEIFHDHSALFYPDSLLQNQSFTKLSVVTNEKLDEKVRKACQTEEGLQSEQFALLKDTIRTTFKGNKDLALLNAKLFCAAVWWQHDLLNKQDPENLE
jgi:hypothetical protein